MAPIKLNILSRSGRTIATLDADTEDRVLDLKKRFHSLERKNAKYYPARQRYTLQPKAGEARGVVLEDDKTLASYGLSDGSSILFKDLGPQVGYATVFFWEYFGPLVVYPLFYFLPGVFYPSLGPSGEHKLVQVLALAYWSFHYTKRIVETFTVHRFGHATMPIFNLFKNCAYYWGFAAFVSYFVNHPLYTAPAEAQSLACLALAMLCQLGNLKSHLILANLRKPGEKDYKIPGGLLFNYVTCANYSFEAWGWLLFAIATQTAAAFAFVAAGTYQMAVWASAKHRRLRKLFDGRDGREKYPRRWVMLPPFF